MLITMKRLALALALLAIVSLDAHAIILKAATLQSAAVATGNGTSASVQGFTTGVIQVTGTFVGTVAFEASADGSNFDVLECFSIGDRTVTATSAASPGTWRCNITGLTRVRARVSAYTSGSITAKFTYLSAGVF